MQAKTSWHKWSLSLVAALLLQLGIGQAAIRVQQVVELITRLYSSSSPAFIIFTTLSPARIHLTIRVCRLQQGELAHKSPCRELPDMGHMQCNSFLQILHRRLTVQLAPVLDTLGTWTKLLQ